jgi:hypothetical protein
VKNGVYCKNMGGGSVNPADGNFSFAVTEAYMIENGKITSPVKDVTLTGNAADSMLKVEGLGNDLHDRPVHRDVRQGRAVQARRRRTAHRPVLRDDRGRHPWLTRARRTRRSPTPPRSPSPRRRRPARSRRTRW